MSSNYELSDKDNIVGLAIQKNSLKFLNHLWNFQNSYLSGAKKTQKNQTTIKEFKPNVLPKRKSILFTDAELYSSILKHGIKLIDLIDLLYRLKENKYFKSIR